MFHTWRFAFYSSRDFDSSIPSVRKQPKEKSHWTFQTFDFFTVESSLFFLTPYVREAAGTCGLREGDFFAHLLFLLEAPASGTNHFTAIPSFIRFFSSRRVYFWPLSTVRSRIIYFILCIICVFLFYFVADCTDARLVRDSFFYLWLLEFPVPPFFYGPVWMRAEQSHKCALFWDVNAAQCDHSVSIIW